MSTQVAFVLVVVIVCVTFLIAFTLENVREYKKVANEQEAKFWRGKYFTLAKVFDKGVGVELSEFIIEELEKLGIKKENNYE